MPPKWPKALPPLSEERQQISDDFMRYWHEQLPQRFAIVERFNHRYPLRTRPDQFLHTIEFGAGLGEHLDYEQLDNGQLRGYVLVEVRENMVTEIAARHPQAEVVLADCQERLPFASGSFDRVVAIHVLEHLPNLPGAIREAHRLLRHDGRFQVVIPCEGGLAYSLARKFSAERLFRRRYGQPYDWFIRREHINRPYEILEELGPHFRAVDRCYWPLRVPSLHVNIALGLTLEPKLAR
jgi:SAM-dependent methyltransferase